MNRIRRTAQTLGLAVATGLALTVVSAAPAQAAPIGTLTFNDLTSQDAAFTLTTSGPCPVGATNFLITLSGGNIPSPSESPNLSGNTPGSSLGGINDGSFTATSQKNLLVFALGNGLSQLGDGSYTATLICRTALSSTSFGEYVGNFTISNGGATITTGTQVAAPTLTTPPAITGTPRVGGTLTCTTGTWTNATSVNVQFLKNNVVAQSSTTDLNIVLGAADLGKSVRCRTTATGPGGSGTPSLTSSVTVAAGAAAKAVAKPKIVGKAKVGKTLKANRGTWSPAASYSYTYVWKRGSKVVKQGTTATSYKLTKKDKKKKITLTVVVKRTGYTTAIATSAAVKVK